MCDVNEPTLRDVPGLGFVTRREWRERERERERQRQRRRDRDRQRQTDRQTDRDRDTQRQKQREKKRERERGEIKGLMISVRTVRERRSSNSPLVRSGITVYKQSRKTY